MEATTYRCDVCNKERGATNHWFAVKQLSEIKFDVVPWDEAVKDGSLRDRKHVCGQNCLHTLLSQWLDNKESEAA